MKLTFVSNYINHHQIPLSSVLYEKLGAQYHFIQTMPMEEERREMGWTVEREALPWLKCWYEEPEACRELVADSDIVVFGGVEDESYIQERLVRGAPVIRYSERLYREGQWKAISPRGLVRKYKDHTRYRNREVYLLCSGAYVASDFHIVRAYPDKMFQWGYFTELKTYEIEKLLAQKPGARGGPVELLFAGRFLPLKHPEYALVLARALKAEKAEFHLTMAGGGELEESLRSMAAREGLEDVVTFTGYQSPAGVRSLMEGADVFLMTSNHLEGWGAVLNEAMNSGCGVIANAQIGAVPYLIKKEKNGMVYRDGDRDEFLRYGIQLVKEAHLRRHLGRNAYDTIVSLWNPVYAAESLLAFAEGITHKKLIINEEGPLSRAAILWPGQGYAYTRRCGE